MEKKYKELNKEGKLEEKGTLIDGVKQGRFVAYKYFDKIKPKKENLNKYLTITLPGKPHIKQKTVGIYKDGLANGDYKTFQNNILVEEGTFIDGLAQGTFKAYKPNYKIKKNIINKFLSFYYRKKSRLFIEGNYKDGRYHGELRYKGFPVTWEEGEVCIYNFREGLKDGTQRVLRESGEIRSISSWKKGLQHGSEKDYYKNGRLERKTTYKDGELHGLEKRYDEDGRLMHQTMWKDGIEHGPYRERVSHDHYTGETLMLERGMYVNGKKKGKYIKYCALLPFAPKKGREDPDWERGVHE